MDPERSRRFSGAYECQGLIRIKCIDVVIWGSESESLRPARQRIILFLSALILMGGWCSEAAAEFKEITAMVMIAGGS
jgi:hypothetical protein